MPTPGLRVSEGVVEPSERRLPEAIVTGAAVKPMEDVPVAGHLVTERDIPVTTLGELNPGAGEGQRPRPLFTTAVVPLSSRFPHDRRRSERSITPRHPLDWALAECRDLPTTVSRASLDRGERRTATDRLSPSSSLTLRHWESRHGHRPTDSPRHRAPLHRQVRDLGERRRPALEPTASRRRGIAAQCLRAVLAVVDRLLAVPATPGARVSARRPATGRRLCRALMRADNAFQLRLSEIRNCSATQLQPLGARALLSTVFHSRGCVDFPHDDSAAAVSGDQEVARPSRPGDKK